MHDLVVEHLGLGDLEDDHGGGEHYTEQTEGECLPRLESDEGQSDRHERAQLELEAEQEGEDHLAQHASASATATCHTHTHSQ